MKRVLVLAAAIIFFIGSISAQIPKVFLVNPQHLNDFKKKIKSGDVKSNQLLKHLLKDADSFLLMKPVSVTEKPQIPPSGSKHDYMSLAPYFWPNPNTPNGLPYIRKDGEHNPDIFKITDKKFKDDVDKSTKSLSLAYFLTGNEKYAAKATEILKVWFIDTATKMNPNLKYAQAVLGVNDGRGTGILETIAFTGVVDAIGLLQGSKSWKADYDKALKVWFEEYLNWMLTSKNGKDEHNAKNNHGIWYDMQVTSFALFLDKKDFVKEYMKSTLARISVQIDSVGKQPLELERTTSLWYSTYSLEAWFKYAMMVENVQADVWNYETADGKGIKKAWLWLLPFAMGEQKWAYQQINPYKKDDLYLMLLMAADKYKNEDYYKKAQQIKPEAGNYLVDIFYDKL
jgi:hypothetical protein